MLYILSTSGFILRTPYIDWQKKPKPERGNPRHRVLSPSPNFQLTDTTLAFGKLTENIRPRLFEFPQQRLPDTVRPDGDQAIVVLRTVQESLMIPFIRRRINRHLHPIMPNLGLKLQRPQQLGNRKEHVAFGQMDPRTGTAPEAVAVVIPVLPVAAHGDVFRRQEPVVLVAFRHEVRGGLPDGVIHVHAPGVVDDNGALGQEFAVDVVVFRERVREVERQDGPPAVAFFDDGVDVGELGPVGPGGGAGVADDAVEFGLGLALDVRVADHGLHDGDDERGRRVGAAFHEDAADEAQLRGRQRVLPLLVQHPVHEGAQVLARRAPGFDLAENIAVQRVHARADGFGARDVVAEPALREPFEEGVYVHRWRGASLHNLGPRLHHRV